jgi:hypothetical protein
LQHLALRGIEDDGQLRPPPSFKLNDKPTLDVKGPMR